jgi:hypothetical protein
MITRFTLSVSWFAPPFIRNSLLLTGGDNSEGKDREFSNAQSSAAIRDERYGFEWFLVRVVNGGGAAE